MFDCNLNLNKNKLTLCLRILKLNWHAIVRNNFKDILWEFYWCSILEQEH